MHTNEQDNKIPNDPSTIAKLEARQRFEQACQGFREMCLEKGYTVTKAIEIENPAITDLCFNQHKNPTFKEENNEIELFSVKCPSCGCIFGLSYVFVYKAGETIYKYSCPYCRFEALLEK